MKKLGQVCALLLIALLGGCGSSSEAAREEVSAQSQFANVDLAGTRNATTSLETATVSGLEPVWFSPIRARARGVHYIGSPAVDHGVVYLQDPFSNVKAIDLDSGKPLWKASFKAPTSGPSGVIVADGLVLGATPRAAFALSAKTGKKIWMTKLTRTETEAITMAPGYHDGLVYISTFPGGGAGDVGVLWALNVKTGRKVWHFDTVPRGLWGHPEVNSGGGLTYAPTFDGEGSMYIGVSQPGPIPGTERYPWGASRLGPNLYSDSVLKLDEKTGRMEWHYQITPHGLCNGYLLSPVLTESQGRRAVVEAGALGIVVALDRETGKLLWRRPVGEHNGHDNDGLRTIRGGSGGLKTPLTILPGKYGGVTSPMSVKGGTIFLSVANSATRLLSQTTIEQVGPESGELVALDVATGGVKWKHRFSSPVYGPTIATNDLVFADSFDGTLAAFDAANGKEVWGAKLPATVEGGMTAAGDTLLVRAGVSAGGPTPALVAYRLGG